MEGSKQITFSISKTDVLRKLDTNSYYRGERLKDEMGAVAARLQSGADNDDVLSDELDIAVTQVVAIISRNLGRCVVSEESDNITFRVLAASLFPNEMVAMVEKAIAAYLFDKTLEGWVLINMPSEVQALGNRSDSDAERLRQLLVEREKPIR
jgi:hypothetical protein